MIEQLQRFRCLGEGSTVRIVVGSEDSMSRSGDTRGIQDGVCCQTPCPASEGSTQKHSKTGLRHPATHNTQLIFHSTGQETLYLCFPHDRRHQLVTRH